MQNRAEIESKEWRNQYLMLSIFGDGKPHTFAEIEWLGMGLFNKKHLDYRIIFKKVLENCLVYREWNSGVFEGDAFILSKKGDYIFRDWAIRMKPKEAGYYRNYDRTPESYAKYAEPINDGGVNA